ncbi:phosphopyruvate hydratase [Leifsonia bigeumensis]|uniref:Enolase n=1 Tax=Leifsonella bigeumensis TaxID=433643 RepID=A0ABP7F6L7_9MICO
MRNSTAIDRIIAWEALDSRGTPTVACEVVLADGHRGQAVVPSGASTGAHEAVELRDGGRRYGGRGVRNAVNNVVTVLAEAVQGTDAADQAEVDRLLRETDGSADLARVGANAVLSVSIAAAIASAQAQGLPLYRAVAGAGAGEDVLLPMPMINVISGGAHAGRAIDIQDVLVVPIGATSFAEALELCWRVRAGTAEVAGERGLMSALVADEGGLGPALTSNRAALSLLVDGMLRAGVEPGVDASIAIDVAASQFFDGVHYHLAADERTLTADELVDELAGWSRDFPIVSLEDVLSEDDWSGWARATGVLGHVQLLGDDLFTTNPARLQRGVDSGTANAVLVKPNQIGTLTEAREVVRIAAAARYATVLSARSGETEDSWLADLAVGWRTGQIKVGSTMRSERTAKWNRLLRIEQELGGRARFATGEFG